MKTMTIKAYSCPGCGEYVEFEDEGVVVHTEDDLDEGDLELLCEGEHPTLTFLCDDCFELLFAATTLN